MKKQKLIGIVLILILIGVSFDILPINLKQSFILVSGDFISTVYTALATIAAISATILTVVVNSFNNKYYGYSLKEIVNFNNEYSKVSFAIPWALISIVVATMFLALNMMNSITFLLTGVVMVMISLSVFLWKLISDDIFCRELVKYEIEKNLENQNSESLKQMLKKLFESFNQIVEHYGIASSEEVLVIISEAIKKCTVTNELGVFLDSSIKNSFNRVCEQRGYIPAIKKVLSLYNNISSEFIKYDRRELLYKPIERLRYLNDKELSKSGLLELSNGLEDINSIDDSDKIFIMYQFFANVYENEIISRKVRENILSDHINHLAEFRWSKENPYDDIKQSALLSIIKNYVLLNEEINEAEFIMKTMSEQLFSYGHATSQKLFETIALIYFSFYVYCEQEVETLKEGHRDELGKLIYVYKESIYTRQISFSLVVQNYFKYIGKSLWNLEELILKYRYLECFPPNSTVKSIVWDKMTLISFAIDNYFLSFHKFSFPPYKMINDWEEKTDKKRYIEKMLNYFEPSTKKLKENQSERLKKLADWINIRIVINNAILEDQFEKLNEEIGMEEELELRSVDNTIPDSEEINTFLKEQIKEHHKYYGYDDSLEINGAEEMHFRPLIQELQYCNNSSNISERIARRIENVINGQIIKTFPEVRLSFDIEGVKKLQKILERELYENRNYTYIDDWGLRKEVRETPEYQKLRELVRGIELISTNPISAHIFFKDKLNYNIEITSYSHEELSGEVCSKYVENLKVSEGLYRVNGAYYNKSKAMEIIKLGYRLELISFKFVSTFEADNGIRIGFDYKL
jgi:uncharacterized membrane protein